MILKPSAAAAIAAALLLANLPAWAQSPTPLPKSMTEYVKKHCVACHSGDQPKAGLSLHNYQDELAVLKGKKAWENVRDMIEAGEMPPKDKPQPTADETTQFLSALKELFVRGVKQGGANPGRVTVRRLNRNEYNNTIRDLVGVDMRPADDFPSDDVGHGFDNIGDVLTLSDVLMERYLAAAEGVMQKAIVTQAPPPPQRTMSSRYLEPAGPNIPDRRYRLVTAEKGESAIESGPLHTPYKLSDDGEYVFRVDAYREGDQPVQAAILLHSKTLADPAPQEKIDQLAGAAVKALQPFKILAVVDLLPKDDKERKPLEVKFTTTAGDIRIGFALLKRGEGPPPAMHVAGFHLGGPSDTRPNSHRQLLSAPEGLADKSAPEQVRGILRRFASRAFRRPATEDEVNRLVKLADELQANGKSYEEAMQTTMQAVLVSPKFLFRWEVDESSSKQGIRALNEFELASRLSYFLWSTMPDQELFTLANQGKLAANLEAQVRRMLKDPKAETLVENFAFQWLHIGRLKQHAPDGGQFQAFNEPLRQAMLKETQLFLAEIIREDRSVLDLVDADYTYVNEPLAKLYGIVDTDGNLSGQKRTKQGQPIRGEQFVRVSLQGDQRGGILTQASVLTVTSNPTRTSPVKRFDFSAAGRRSRIGRRQANAHRHVAGADAAASRKSGLRQLPRQDGCDWLRV
jgi:hypothetical protein